MPKFLVDTNFFIQAHRATYPMDIATTYWGLIKKLASQETIISIDKVKAELYENDDELKGWCQNNLPKSFFKNTNSVLKSYSEIANWAETKSDHYSTNALKEFLDAKEADAWLIAYAIESNLILVTYEVSDPKRKNKIKIPDVCNAFSLQYMNPIEMLRNLGEKF